MNRKTAVVSEPENNCFSIGRRSWDIIWRWGLLLTAVILFASGLIYSVLIEDESMTDGNGRCMGVPILSYKTADVLGSYHYRDYSEHLKFQDEFAAVDVEQSTIYIPQKINTDTVPEDLEGMLAVDMPGCRLYFAADENWDDLKSAAAENHKFQLLISDPSNTYMRYDVVFTTLPVMSLYGELFYKEEVIPGEEVVSVMAGRMVLWDPDETRYGVHTSRLHLNIRGGSSKNEPKNPWRLTLKDWNGHNNNEDLLRLGSDDDWILNPMNMEDSNIREKLFMDLWNEMAEETQYNYPMSRAEYVEVLINGEYFGLCLLQRRMDEKYLELEENKVLVKAKPREAELICEYFPGSRENLLMNTRDDFLYNLDCSAVRKDNFTDISLFLQLFSAVDNCNYKNMYYVFAQEADRDTITLIPWDTDMTMGAVLGFKYDLDKSVQTIVNRREMDPMQKLYPELDDLMQDRWAELRKGIFSLEHITQKMDEYLSRLEASGAPERDEETWGLFYGGEDTPEKLYRFVEERLKFLDDYYAQ